MRGDRHAAVSEMLLETAETLAQNPRTTLAAGELIWGAAFHASCAAERHPNEPHQQPHTRRELREIISHLAIDRRIRRNLIGTLDHAVRRLHDNFYSGQLSNTDLFDDIEVGTSFVRELLHIAQRT